MEKQTTDRDNAIRVRRERPLVGRTAARERFARAVAAIVAEDRLPAQPADASDIDLCERATALISRS